METKEIQGVKTIFISAKAKNIDVIPVLKKLKLNVKRIGLISAVQYVDYLGQAKEFLEKKGFEVIIAGQMVGCNSSNAIKIKDSVDAYVFIGSGEFHPLELVNYTNIDEIYLVNPVSQNITKFDKEELVKLERKKIGKIKKYLTVNKIGILVSVKPGQNALKAALKFAENCGKEAYVFMADEIDINKLEDFNDIKLWVNTSCPRLEGNNIVSLKDIIGSKLVDYHTY
jgi:2-(3-amino-3-carboxypropyl)histidine synthase